MSQSYILDADGAPVRCDDTAAWGEWFEQASLSGDRVVARDEIGRYTVSTVFLGLDHDFTGRGPPVLWETMIFADDGYDDLDCAGEMQRYSALDAARLGHARIVRELRAALEIEPFG